MSSYQTAFRRARARRVRALAALIHALRTIGRPRRTFRIASPCDPALNPARVAAVTIGQRCHRPSHALAPLGRCAPRSNGPNGFHLRTAGARRPAVTLHGAPLPACLVPVPGRAARWCPLVPRASRPLVPPGVTNLWDTRRHEGTRSEPGRTSNPGHHYGLGLYPPVIESLLRHGSTTR